MYGLHTVGNSRILPQEVEYTPADPAVAGLRTLLPSMTERFHVLEAGPTRLLLR